MAAFAAVLILSACGRGTPSRAHVREVLLKNSSVQKLESKDGNELVHVMNVAGPELYTEKFQHKVDGIEVLGSGVGYHLGQDGTESVSAHLAQVSLSTRPGITVSEAVERAQRITDEEVQASAKLKILPATQDHDARLIYVVPLAQDGEVWINAEDGSHIATLEESNDVAQQMVRSADQQGIVRILIPGACSVSGLTSEKFKTVNQMMCELKVQNSCQVLNMQRNPVSYRPEKCKEVESSDMSAIRAQSNAAKFLDYFKSTFNRDSFDGQGAKIISIVHAGIKYANATWFKKGEYIAYGDGDGVTFRDFTFATDVAGHEMTHALIQHSANLVSFGETGALNESIADYFGKRVEGSENWNIGGELFIGGNSSSALRDLMNPSRLMGQFTNESGDIVERSFPVQKYEVAGIIEPCVGSNDYCGIHFNSTVPGHAWYLIHKKLGSKKAENLIYLALTHYFHELTNFEEAAKGTLEACSVSLSDSDCSIVKGIFKSSGMIK